MNAMSLVIIFAFYQELKFDRIIIERNFRHFLQKLADVSYVTRYQLVFANATTMLQLKDCTIKVSQRNDKTAISEIFTAELKFSALLFNKLV